jgi:excisionase family DNA binding protein
LWTKPEAAKYLGVSPRKLEYLIHREKAFPVIRIGGNVRLDRADVVKFVKARAGL